MYPAIAKSVKIKTRVIPRLRSGAGIQITATVRPELAPEYVPGRLERKIRLLIEQGVSHFCLNLSHFRPDNTDNELSRDEYEARWRQLVQHIDRVGRETGAHVFLMLDTAGPEFRIVGSDVPALEPDMVVALSSADHSGRGAAGVPVVRLSMPADFESFGKQEDVVDREVSIADGECTAVALESCGKEILVRVNHGLALSPGRAIKVNFPGFKLHGVTSVGPCDAESLRFFLTIPRVQSS
jgi:pyruvate kinase